MKLSFAVTVSTEIKEIENLIKLLAKRTKTTEIVVQYDSSNTTLEVIEFLNKSLIENKIDKLVSYPLNGDFANFKNHLNANCSGEFIYQLDADELIDSKFLKALPNVLDNNKDIDLFFVPRINTVNGLTEEHIQKWGWNVNEKGWVNFPDVQTRIYKNKQSIFWAGKVHERIQGFESYSVLPAEEIYCIQHHKDIKRQEKQNALYDTI
jgi:glycosyltransferase involved in cell wall biosynthesis